MYTKKLFQLNLFDFIFLSQHAFSQFFISSQKEVCLNFVVPKLPKNVLLNIFAKVFGQTNYLVTKQ